MKSTQRRWSCMWRAKREGIRLENVRERDSVENWSWMKRWY